MGKSVDHDYDLLDEICYSLTSALKRQFQALLSTLMPRILFQNKIESAKHIRDGQGAANPSSSHDL
jgi:hypothetical protein